MDPLRLLIIADDPLARAGLSTLLAQWPECEVVGQLAAGDLLAQLDVYRPELLLWDLGWDAEQVPEELGDSGYPVLALLPDDTLAPAAWAAGVQGLLLRDVAAPDLQLALQGVSQGLSVLESPLADALRPAAVSEEMSLPEPLTPREQEVLNLLAEGLSNRAIGQQLAISEHTVKFHVNAIMGKLDARSRTEAVVRASRLGLLLL